MAKARTKTKRIQGTIRVADCFPTRLRGLMFREHWPEHMTGYWFKDCSFVHTCFVSMDFDLIFLDSENRVTRHVECPRPWRFYVGPPGTVHTLEVFFGVIRQLDLKVGDRVVMDK
jgi:uncharacterized membrane protein (UPF0127 family)